MLKKTAFLFLFNLTVIASVEAQPYLIHGRITDQNGEALPGALIYIHETLNSTQSDDFGKYELNHLRPGHYHLHSQMLGYDHWSMDVDISDNSTYEINIRLKEKINALEEVVIETDRNKLTRQESSQSIVFVNEKFIEKKNGNTLMETMERLPGISSINTGTGVAKPVIRGLSFARVAVMDNGIKQEGQQWGADHGLEIDQYAVEQVEVIKGPGSLMYGSDAMGGVISLGQPKLLQPGTHNGEIRTIYKSNNDTYGVSASVKGNQNQWVYQARVTALEYGDVKVPEDTFYFQDTYFPIFNGRLKNTAGRELHGQIMIGRNGSRGYTHLTVSNYLQRVGIFTGAIGRVTTDRLFPDGDRNIGLSYQNIQHFKAILNSNLSLGKGWLESDMGFQHNTRREFSFPHTHGQPLPENQTLALELGLSTFSSNTRYHIKHSKGFQTIIGLQHSQQFNRAGGFEFLIPAFANHQAGLYLIEKYKLNDKMVINAGLRGEWAYQRADQTVLPFYRRMVYIDDVERNPQINNIYLNYAFNTGLSVKMNPIWSAKLNFGKSFRMPTIPELTSFGMHHASYRFEQGDPNLNPEEGFQLDGELTGEGKKWSVSVSPFYYYFSNFIFQRPTGFFPRITIDGAIYPLPSTSQVYQYTQTAAELFGLEAQVQYQPLSWLRYYCNIEQVTGNNLNIGLPLPFIPPLAAFQGISILLPRLSTNTIKNIYFDVEWGIYEAQFKVDRNERTTTGYGLWHISFGTSIFAKGKELAVLSFQVRNLTNETYFNHLSRYRLLNLPEPARNFVVMLAFKFNKNESKGI